jgi:hypothetical protein
MKRLRIFRIVCYYFSAKKVISLQKAHRKLDLPELKERIRGPSQFVQLYCEFKMVFTISLPQNAVFQLLKSTAQFSMSRVLLEKRGNIDLLYGTRHSEGDEKAAEEIDQHRAKAEHESRKSPQARSCKFLRRIFKFQEQAARSCDRGRPPSIAVPSLRALAPQPHQTMRLAMVSTGNFC